MKSLKLLAAILGALLLTLTVTLALVLVQPNWFKKPLNRAIESQTGLQLTVEQMDSGLSPASFSIKQLSLKNAQGDALLDAEAITLEVQDWPSLSSPFFSLTVTAPHIRYQLDEKGRSNWPEGKDRKPDPTPPQAVVLPGDFSFYRIAIERGQLDIDLPGQERRIALPSLTLSRDAQHKASLDLVTEIDQERFELTGDFTLLSEHLLGIKLDAVNPSASTLLEASLSTRPQLDGTDGELSLNLYSTDFLSRLLGTSIPKIPGAKFSANFAIGEHYTLTNLLVKVGEQSLTGSADFSPVDNHLTVELEADKLAVDELVAALQEMPADGGTQTPETKDRNQSAAATPDAEIDWQALSGIELDASIRVGDFSGFGWSGQTLSAHTVLRNKGSSAPKLAIAASGKAVRNVEQGIDLSSLSLEADLAALDLKTSGADADLTLKVQLNDRITLNVDGRANFNGLAEQSFKLALDAPQSAELWALANLPYAEAGPLSIKGSFTSEESTFKPDLAIMLGEQQLDIEVNYSPAEDKQARPQLAVVANGRNLDARFLSPPPQGETAPPKEVPEDKNKVTTPLFSREALDTELLRSFDADLSIDVKTLVTAVTTLDEISLIAQLKDGRLTARESRLRSPGNDLTMSMSVDFSKALNKTRFELTLNTEDAGKLGLEQAAQIKGGRGKVNIALEGEGASPHDIAASLKGAIDLKLQDMMMENNQLDLVGSDIITELVTKLNPFAKSDPVTEVECLSVHFDADKGIFDSDKALHVETRKMKIIGNGEIDLGNETLSLNFTPIARKGLGVNLSYLVKLVKVRGDLQSPGIGVDAGGLVSSALSTSAAVATGGASLVAQSLLERAANSGSACDPDKKLELDIPTEEELEAAKQAPAQ